VDSQKPSALPFATPKPTDPFAPAPAEYVDEFVAARRLAWIRGNTSHSPQGASKPGEPSAQHIATWTEMAHENFVKENRK
jgi:hypothetical protein